MKTKVSNDEFNGISNTTISIEFPNFNQVTPEKLIGFSKEYLDHVPKLLDHITTNIHTMLFLTRIEPDGTILKKGIMGTISDLNITEKTFYFTSGESFFSIISEEETRLFIRLDNVLGIIPTIPGYDINPYKNPQTKEAANYLKYLKKMQELGRLCVDTTHAATLSYRGNNNIIERIDGEILKVNKSNIVFLQRRSIESGGEKNLKVSTGSLNKIILNISTQKYLFKIWVHFGIKHCINPFDEGDT